VRSKEGCRVGSQGQGVGSTASKVEELMHSFHCMFVRVCARHVVCHGV